MGRSAEAAGDGRSIREAMGSVCRVGLLGCGNVGAAVVRMLGDHASDIERRAGVRLEVARVAVRDLSLDRGVSFPPDVLTTDASSVVADPSIDLVAEVIGGIDPARTLSLTAFVHGKPVATANTELLSARGVELSDAAAYA